MVDFPTPMAEFPTPMAEFPTPMADSPRSGVVTKTFAPKFCAEWSDREIRNSYGDYFRDNFCVYVSGPKVDPDPKKCPKLVEKRPPRPLVTLQRSF